MANYAYGALAVSVVADTRGLTSQVAAASRNAGKSASASISGELTRGLGGVAKSTGKALGSVATVAAGGMAAFVGSAVKAGVAYNVLYSSSLKAFKTILGTDKAAQAMMTNIEKFGKTSPFPRQAFISATQQMLAFGYSAKDVIPTLTAVQDAVAATGGGAEDIKGIVTVLAKIKSSGKITAETLNMLGDRGINAAELIGKGMGKSANEIRDSITSSSLDSEKALTALTQQMGLKYKGAAGGLKSTWTGAKDSIHGAMRDIGSAIVEPFISKKGGGLAIEWANKLSKTLWALKPAVTPLVNAFMQSLAPAIAAVNTGVNWLLDQVNKLVSPQNLPAATKWVKQFGATALAAFAGFGAIAGAGILTQLPLVGPIISGLLGPLKELGGLLGGLGGKLAKGTLVKFIPQMKGVLGISEKAATALPALSGPLLVIIGLFVLLMATSAKFRNAVFGFVKTLMVALGPVIAALFIGIKEVISTIAALGKELGDTLAPIINKLTPLLIPLGRILGFVLVVAFKILGIYLKAVVWEFGLIFRVIGVVIGWLLKLITPIQLLITWIAYKLVPVLIVLGRWFTRVFKSVSATVSAAFRAMMAVILPIWNSIVHGIMAAVNWVVSALTTAWNWIAAVTRTVFGVIVTVVKIAWAVIATVIDIAIILIKAYIAVWWLVLSTIGKAIWSVIGAPVTAAWNAILAVTQVVWSAVTGAITVAWNAVTGAITIALAWINSIITTAWNWLIGISTTLWNMWSTVVMAVWNAVKTGIGAALGWIKAVISQAWAWLIGNAAACWNAIWGVILTVFNFMKQGVLNIFSWIKWFINLEWQGILAISRAVWSVIGGTITGIWNGIKNTIGGAVGWVVGKIAGAWNSVFGTVKQIWGQISGYIVGVWSNIKTKATSAAGDIIRGMFQGFTNALKNVSQWVNDHIVQPIIKAVKDHFKIGSPSKVMAGLGGDMISGLFQGLNPGNWLKMVKTVFGGLPEALGAIVSKGLIAVEKLPSAALSALGGIAGKVGGFLGGLFGGGKNPTVSVKTSSYSGIMKAVLASFGHPELYGTFMQQMMTESGGNPNAINLWDSNAKAGHPSQGLMQVIPSTFAAYAGPYRSRGILDPLANIYAAVNYALSRYGRRIGSVLGHGHGYAAGGIIREPISGIGHWTGSAYSFGERGPERVSPLLAGGLTAEENAMLGAMRGGGINVHVYPRESQSEVQIAAAVSRELGWAAAAGGGA